MIAIYALRDPITSEVRYIGKAINPAKRLHRHLTDARAGKDNYKDRWIRTTLARGGPTQEILQWCHPNSWKAAERHWIKRGRELGWRLTNTSCGGEGRQTEVGLFARRFSRAINRCDPGERMNRLARCLVRMAVAGNLGAICEMYNRTIGKPQKMGPAQHKAMLITFGQTDIANDLYPDVQAAFIDGTPLLLAA